MSVGCLVQRLWLQRSCRRAPSLIAWASKSAVECVFGCTSQSILAACTSSLGPSTPRSVRWSRIARCRDAFRSPCVCHSACGRPGSPLPDPGVRHLHMELVLRSSALLEPDTEELYSSLSPMGPLREPRQHTCLKHPYRTLGSHPSPKSWLSGYHVLKDMQECHPP